MMISTILIDGKKSDNTIDLDVPLQKSYVVGIEKTYC